LLFFICVIGTTFPIIDGGSASLGARIDRASGTRKQPEHSVLTFLKSPPMRPDENRVNTWENRNVLLGSAFNRG
jgi:hypothetical protein